MILIEKLIVCKLIAELDVAGFVPVQFWDGEEYQPITWKSSCPEAIPVQREGACIAAVRTVDEGTLHFAPKHDLAAWGNLGVLLILGNGGDIISDYHCGNKDFDAVLDRVSAFIRQRI